VDSSSDRGLRLGRSDSAESPGVIFSRIYGTYASNESFKARIKPKMKLFFESDLRWQSYGWLKFGVKKRVGRQRAFHLGGGPLGFDRGDAGVHCL